MGITHTRPADWIASIEHVPGARVLGVVREGKGLLLEINEQPSASKMRLLEQQLLDAGCSDWAWQGTRIRVYWERRNYNTLLALAITAIAYFLYNDIHLAQTINGWTGAQE